MALVVFFLFLLVVFFFFVFFAVLFCDAFLDGRGMFTFFAVLFTSFAVSVLRFAMVFTMFAAAFFMGDIDAGGIGFLRAGRQHKGRAAGDAGCDNACSDQGNKPQALAFRRFFGLGFHFRVTEIEIEFYRRDVTQIGRSRLASH